MASLLYKEYDTLSNIVWWYMYDGLCAIIHVPDTRPYALSYVWWYMLKGMTHGKKSLGFVCLICMIIQCWTVCHWLKTHNAVRPVRMLRLIRMCSKIQRVGFYAVKLPPMRPVWMYLYSFLKSTSGILKGTGF